MARSLPCDYTGAAVPRMAPYSVLPRNAHTTHNDTLPHAGDVRVLAAASHGGHATTAPGYAVLDPLDMVSSSSTAIAVSSSSSTGQMAAAPLPSPRAHWPPPLHVDLNPSHDTTTLDAASAIGLIEPCHNVFTFLNSITMDPPPSDDPDDEDTRLRNPVTGSGTQSDFLLHDKASRVLTRRRALTASSVLATRTILGQVCSYPAMMVSGHALPPFIHSRCSLDDGLTTPVSSDFVWETIYNEIGRMHKEHESFDSETMLESIQALTIYMLLQAQDTETLLKNNVKLLLITIGVRTTPSVLMLLTTNTQTQELGPKLHSSLEYNTLIDTIESPLCRSTWVLYESARRTLCLLYIIEMFLEINLRPRPISARCCQSFAATPLPCIRDLWEVPSTYDWSKRYSAFLRGRSVAKILTLRDYKMTQHLSPEELLDGVAGLNGVAGSGTGSGSGSVTKDVMRWCEGMDSFGTLVTLAATLLQYEVAPSGVGGNGLRIA
ncbi:hypothetical protein A9Z42_0055150 [Trichoderma parareesei]|uniref:Transcription factor domain-containing protein n=1 Tax=Trichoderma parareesei TaxID=858221 RepID=A0A2H2ZJQ1_TRIPA|nr:hypothetical protein A9Z42_0055150 [Trichoderma parareesei]